MGHNNPGSDTNRTGGSSSAFFRYYDRNLEDTPLSLIRLGELQGKTDEVTRVSSRRLNVCRINIHDESQEILRKRQFTRPALDTFIHLWSRRNQGTVAATKDLAVMATEDLAENLAEDLAETTPVDTEGDVPPTEQDLLPLLPKYFTAGEGCRLSQAGRLAVLVRAKSLFLIVHVILTQSLCRATSRSPKLVVRSMQAQSFSSTASPLWQEPWSMGPRVPGPVSPKLSVSIPGR